VTNQIYSGGRKICGRLSSWTLF